MSGRLGSTLLIANRGEIAVRIARTAHRLGLTTVGVYSDPDRTAMHLDHVDLAAALGGASPAESYLRIDAILAAANAAGATAVHPGYGFLAENADFAQAVIDAGLAWVGPTPDQIRLLGDKIAAKRAAIDAGVPTTEIVEVSDADTGEPIDVAAFPVLVKAAAGGGGRGMRVVRGPDELADAVEAASREAASAFGDGTVFVEPFIERGRHVEVQIFGDAFGNVVHLGERECSIQRRNQKVIEEAPSPGITDAVRVRLLEGAVAIARSVGYIGAGTVEFMVADHADDHADDTTVSFLEVNTRLQVEHPVTEAVTGFDLVEWQLAVADGRPLPVDQRGVSIEGHAIEVRLVAEDPAEGWLPSTGTLAAFAIDDLDGTVRVDAGYQATSTVSADYDSLLAKVISHGPDRATAARRLARSMRRTAISGVRTNAATLAAILHEPDFLAARTPTCYLDEHPDVATASTLSGRERDAHLIAATFALEFANRDADDVTGFAPSGWRNLRTQGQRRTLVHDPGGQPRSDGSFTPGTHRGVSHHIEYVVEHRDASGTTTATVLLGAPPVPGDDGSLPADERRAVTIGLIERSADRQVVEVDGIRWAIGTTVTSDPTTTSARVTTSSRTASTEWVMPPRFDDHDTIDPGSGPVSPLPGTVIAVHVAPGDEVAQGQLVMVVEAMKMEHQITAVADAVVVAVPFGVGDRVDSGDLLVELDTGADATSE